MSKDTDPLGRLIRENIEMASNQIKHNVEMGVPQWLIPLSRWVGCWAWRQLLRMEIRKEMMASAERMKDSFCPDPRS